MAGQADFLNILREIRGSAAPGQPLTDGIWYELTVADKNGNPGVYGDILAKYGVVTESAGTFDQAVAILENLNVEVTTLPAGSAATSALVNGVWQIGIPIGIDGTDGNDGNTPELTMTYDAGSIKYTVTVDGVVVTNTNLINLDTLVDSKVSTNVGVQETLEAKQDVLDAVATAQGISDSLDANVVAKKQEIAAYTNVKINEIGTQAELEKTELDTHAIAKVNEYNANALNKLNQYNDNHTNKLSVYNTNDSIKLNQYNENHIERLSEINYAYADRIIEMIKTRNFMGIMDEYVAKTATHMITFLDTTDANYVYYANGTLLVENVDYTVYNNTTIELTVKANPYDVIVQVNTQVLKDMLTVEGVLFDDRLGQPNGVASLNVSGKVPSEQLPSYVDDVIEVNTYAELPVVGESGKIYVVITDETSNGDTTTYRWTGTVYAVVSNTLNASDVKALYETNPDTNAYTDAEKSRIDINTDLTTTAQTLPTAVNELDNRVANIEDNTTLAEYGITDAYTKTENDTLLALKVNNSDKGVANGIATLDANGKVVLTQIPDSVLGQLEYIGTWNFTTFPTATQKGQYWIASVSGNGYEVGDWAVWNGTAFDKVNNTDAVATVAGRTGNVVLTKSDVGLGNVDNTADSAKNVLSATTLTTARTISLTGDVTGNVSFNGSANVSIATTVADDSHNHIISNVDGLQAALDSKANQSSTYTKLETEQYVQQMLSDGGNDVYIGSYGLEWNETTDTYRRIGAANYTAIQSMMRRCVLNSDGSVNYYLDKNNSNLKEDGTLANLDGTDGNVMVEVPKTYVRYEYTTTGVAGTDTVHRWEISLEPETGFEPHWAFDRGGSIRNKRYYPAYQGYVKGGKLISRSGVYPTTNVTLPTFRVYSKANSVTNPSTGETPNGYWSNIDFALYELITLLCVIEYGTMNIQSALGQGRTALTGGTWVGGSLIGVTGLSNGYGNRTANYTYAGSVDDANADLSFMSYRGCENFFGNIWRMADGVIFKGTTNNKTMWYSTNPASYNNDATGYTNSGIVTASAAGGYGRKLGNTNKGFIITDVTDGNSNAGTTDYYYTSTTDDTMALVGGTSRYGLYAGPLSLHVNLAAASAAAVYLGCGVSF